MNERTSLLRPGGDLPAVAIHNVYHDATSQMGLCAFCGSVKTDVVCEVCKKWICKAHQGSMVICNEPEQREWCIPCVSIETITLTQASPTCPNCSGYEQRPPDYPKYGIRKLATSIYATVVIVMTIFVIVAVSMN